jgi:hypothetical protein
MTVCQPLVTFVPTLVAPGEVWRRELHVRNSDEVLPEPLQWVIGSMVPKASIP